MVTKTEARREFYQRLPDHWDFVDASAEPDNWVIRRETAYSDNPSFRFIVNSSKIEHIDVEFEFDIRDGELEAITKHLYICCPDAVPVHLGEKTVSSLEAMIQSFTENDVHSIQDHMSKFESEL